MSNSATGSFVVSAAIVAAALIAGPAAHAVSWDGNGDGTSWGDPINWLGNLGPGPLDTAALGDLAAAENDFVDLTLNDTIAGLDITDGMVLDTNGFVLLVNGDTTVSGENLVGQVVFPSRLRVDRGVGLDDFDTNNLTLSNDGEVDLRDGGILEVDNVFSIPTTTALRGDGVVDFEGTEARVLILDGTLQAGTSGMILNQNNTGRLDLDGNSGNSSISIATSGPAGDSTLTVNGDQLADSFSGTITIGSDSVLTMNLTNGWTADSGSDINLLGADVASADGPARIAGDTFTIQGNVDNFGEAHIDAPAVVESPATINYFDSEPINFNAATTVTGGTFQLIQGSQLNFNGGTSVSGGTFNTFSTLAADGTVEFNGTTSWSGTTTINGIAQQDGDASVFVDAVINADVFDMDGNTGGGQNWNIGADLTINADAIETVGTLYNGVISINSGNILFPASLTVNLPGIDFWSIGQVINSTGPGAGFIANTLNGSDVRLSGTANIDGNNAWTARFDIISNGTVNIAAGSTLRLTGGTLIVPNFMSGNATINGPGKIDATAGRGLHGNGTINADIDFTGTTSQLMADNGTLTVNGAILDVGEIGTADGDGTLVIANPFNTSIAEVVRLNGGEVTGALLDNFGGTIRGFGLVTNDIDNGGLIAAQGATLELAGASVNLDGLAFDPNDGAGSLDATNGDLLVSTPVDVAFVGTLDIGAGRSFTYQSGNPDTLRFGDVTDDSDFNGDFGRLNFRGGSLVMDFVELAGSVTVIAAPATISATATFDSTGTNSTSEELRMDGDSTVRAGATFSGTGSLVNLPGRTMTLEDGADVAILLDNRGTVTLGASPGQTTGDRFQQAPSGTLEIEILDTGAGDFDSMALTGLADFSGTLNVSLLGGFEPALNDTFTILTANGGVFNTFDTVNAPIFNGINTLAAVYNPNSVVLEVICLLLPGDANNDGAVTADDLIAVQQNFGDVEGGPPTGKLLGDANDDGTVTADDLVAVQQNFGDTLGPAAATAVPEPGAAATVAVLAMAGATRRRRR